MSEYTSELQNALIGVAHDLADTARVETLRYFRTNNLNTENKWTTGFDPVTEADKAAERVMRDRLALLRPADAILGEEYGPKSGNSGLTWVLDPIDGTRGYLSGTPTWGTLISVANDSGPLFGIIDQPYVRERFCGGFGQAYHTGPMGDRKNRTRDTKDLSDAVIFTTFPEVGTPEDRQAFEAVAKRCKLIRFGMDCYAYALLAAGQIDLVIESGLAPYDIQAPIAVIQAAGGIVTNWDGTPAHAGGRVIAAANAQLHEQALRVMHETIGAS